MNPSALFSEMAPEVTARLQRHSRKNKILAALLDEAKTP
jgi:predicted Rossmann fold nucleotide-binding protein DprA/Smf involved in DNA uptake